MKTKMKSVNYPKVLHAIQKAIGEAEGDEREVWFEAFNEMLDSLASDDFFGTEGQCDPRGDQRD